MGYPNESCTGPQIGQPQHWIQFRKGRDISYHHLSDNGHCWEEPKKRENCRILRRQLRHQLPFTWTRRREPCILSIETMESVARGWMRSAYRAQRIKIGVRLPAHWCWMRHRKNTWHICYSYFYISAVRVESLKSIRDIIEGAEYTQLLVYAKTRFLALGAVIGSILKIFEPLKECGCGCDMWRSGYCLSKNG